MYKIAVEWKNGLIEIVDETYTTYDAMYLVQEYIVAFGHAALKVWYY